MSVRCDMRHDCTNAVAMIGSKGYVYCRAHGIQRRGIERTRLMRPWELKLVEAGKPIPSYEPLPRAVALAGGVNAYLNRNLPGGHVDPAVDRPDSATRSVVDRPDSVTHWTCPKAPGAGMTHHLAGSANKCRYCHRDAAELRAEQAEILGGAK